MTGASINMKPSKSAWQAIASKNGSTARRTGGGAVDELAVVQARVDDLAGFFFFFLHMLRAHAGA